MDQKQGEELVRRFAAALRGIELYSPSHPLVERALDALTAAAAAGLKSAPSIVIGFVGDEVVVDGSRLPRGTASLAAFARDLRERDVEKITFTRGLTRDEMRSLVALFSERTPGATLADRLSARGIRHVTLGRIVVEEAGRAGRHCRGAARVRHGSADRREPVAGGQGGRA